MTLSPLRLFLLVGMVALLLGAAPLAQTPEVAQDGSIEALRTRANAGDADAQLSLALKYANGGGVPQDDVEAYKWFILATTYADVSEHGKNYVCSHFFARSRSTILQDWMRSLPSLGVSHDDIYC